MKRLILIAGLLPFLLNLVFAQLSLNTFPEGLEVHAWLLPSVDAEGSPGPQIVAVEMYVRIASEIRLEVRDALGFKLFESVAVYPEGKQIVRLGMGSLDQGIYFVRVSNNWDEKLEVVSVLEN